ncbi:hypothetical protein TrispH2_011982 [Trichoplax sp. H2]|nr:hypothetical protein TrispH2_011982 [Trichoplax sp. H2]|eukprot:RDD36048.1 hypothetical protein TrispH2_011982 [Trichoplax sp. H2]
MANFDPNMLNSANTGLMRTLMVVSNLSIASLVLSSVLLVVGIMGLFVPYVTIFAIGLLAALNCYWVTVPILITSILGICGYRKGQYRHNVVAQAPTVIAYVGTSITVAIYIFFFYYCIHGAVIFRKVPRKAFISNATNLSTMPVPLQQDAVVTGYVGNPATVSTANYNYQPDYSNYYQPSSNIQKV